MRNKSSLKQVLTLTRGHWDRPETRASVRKNFANMIDCRTPALVGGMSMPQKPRRNLFTA